MAIFRNDLKFDVNDVDLDTLQNMQIHLDSVIEGFKKYNWEIPEYMTEKVDSIKVEIDVRINAEKLRKLKLLKMRRAGLLTKEEQKTQIDIEIAKLETELNS